MYGCKPTAIGAARIAAAVIGSELEFVEMAFGDGNGLAVPLDPVPAALVHEVHRVDLSSVTRPAPDSPQLRFRGILPPELGGITVREAGVFDAQGDLILYGALPPLAKHAMPGTGHDMIIELIAEISPAANIVIQVNPSMVLATLEDVDLRITAALRADRPFRYYRNGA